MDVFLDANLPGLNNEEIHNLNRPITGNEMEAVIRSVLERTAGWLTRSNKVE